MAKPAIINPVKLLKTIRNTILAILVLTILTLILGVVYTAFVGRPGVHISPTTAQVAGDSSSYLKPSTPSPSARESASVESLTSEAKAGSTVSIIIRTNATSTCTITAAFADPKGSDLGPHIADGYGSVTWSWQLVGTAPLGSQFVKVICVYHGRSAVAGGNYQIVQ